MPPEDEQPEPVETGVEGPQNGGVSLSSSTRDALNSEIESCQDRIVRVLVPTIVSFGITTVGRIGTDAAISFDVLFGALFAVLFSSSLYIASMSYKIFERAAFLRVLSGEETDWETVIRRYRDEHSPRVIGSETSAISWIYIVLAVMFGLLFWDKIWTPTVVVATVVLLAVAVRIWLIPRQSSEARIDRKVNDVLDSLDE